MSLHVDIVGLREAIRRFEECSSSPTSGLADLRDVLWVLREATQEATSSCEEAVAADDYYYTGGLV